MSDLLPDDPRFLKPSDKRDGSGNGLHHRLCRCNPCAFGACEEPTPRLRARSHILTRLLIGSLPAAADPGHAHLGRSGGRTEDATPFPEDLVVFLNDHIQRACSNRRLDGVAPFTTPHESWPN